MARFNGGSPGIIATWVTFLGPSPLPTFPVSIPGLFDIAMIILVLGTDLVAASEGNTRKNRRVTFLQPLLGTLLRACPPI